MVNKKVVVAGHICLDIIPDLREMLLERPGEFYTPGALKIAKPAKISTGGPVSNTGLNLTKLGIETNLMGKVGGDAFGDMVQLLLKKSGVWKTRWLSIPRRYSTHHPEGTTSSRKAH